MDGYQKLINECDMNIAFYSTHLSTLRTIASLCEASKRMFKSIDQGAAVSDYEEIIEVNNYAGFVAISILDLSVILKGLVSAKSDWERGYFIKHSYLTIYEALKKFDRDEFKQKGFFIETLFLQRYPEFTLQFSRVLEAITIFTSGEHYKKVQRVRHNIAGHIQHSLKTYYDIVIALNGEEAAKLVSEFLKILYQFFELLKDYSLLANKKANELSEALKSKISEVQEKLSKSSFQ